jgi:hypothetical protein
LTWIWNIWRFGALRPSALTADARVRMRRNSAIRKLVHSFGLESDSFRSTEGGEEISIRDIVFQHPVRFPAKAAGRARGWPTRPDKASG